MTTAQTAAAISRYEILLLCPKAQEASSTGPVSYTHLYQSFSAFAGNPYFISLDALVEEGVLTAAECKKASFGRKADDIDYSRLYTERGRLLRLEMCIRDRP